MVCAMLGSRFCLTCFTDSYTDLYTIPGFILPHCYPPPLPAQTAARFTRLTVSLSFPSPRISSFIGDSDPSGMIQPECRTVLLRLGSVRGPGSSCDHWLLGRCCSFSTMIPGTAPRRCTSPAHGDASRRVIPTTVHKTHGRDSQVCYTAWAQNAK